MDKRRILSIDGGGIKGVFPASFLAHLEDNIDGHAGEYFDLIAGTSTGGIIALGLGMGLSARDLLQFYEANGPILFTQNRVKRLFLAFKHWAWSKYDNKTLRAALEAVFDDKRIADSQTRLMIPSLNLETGEVHVYKTRHAGRFGMDYKERVVDVALATSAAPTYFPTHHSAQGLPLVDGGMWANNPTGFAVVEGISVLGWPAESLHILSIGCTESPVSTGLLQRLPLGNGFWAKKIVDIFMAGQSSSSMGTAILLSGRDQNRLVRVSPCVQTGRFSLDGSRDIQTLKGLGHSEARKAWPKVREMFFREKAEPFEPIPLDE